MGLGADIYSRAPYNIAGQSTLGHTGGTFEILSMQLHRSLFALLISLTLCDLPSYAEQLFVCDDNRFSNIASEGCTPFMAPPIQKEPALSGDIGIVPLQDIPLGQPVAQRTDDPAPIFPNNQLGAASQQVSPDQISKVLIAVQECLGGINLETGAGAQGCKKLEQLEFMNK